MAERARRDPKVQQILEKVKMLDGLREHAGWRYLYERVKADRERFLHSISRRLMAGQKVSQSEIDYTRGFYAGAEWIVTQPEKAVESLERAARHAWTIAQLELETTEKEAEPYA